MVRNRILPCQYRAVLPTDGFDLGEIAELKLLALMLGMMKFADAVVAAHAVTTAIAVQVAASNLAESSLSSALVLPVIESLLSLPALFVSPPAVA